MNPVNISVQTHGPNHINQESSNVLTFEAVVRPGEVAPIPNLEVELGALQPHQRAPARRRRTRSLDPCRAQRIKDGGFRISEDEFRCVTKISAKQARTEKLAKQESMDVKEGGKKYSMDRSNRQGRRNRERKMQKRRAGLGCSC